MYYQSRSIILKNRDLRESDQLLTIFSEKEGKITAVAKGVKKAKSSLRGCVQPFCHSLLFFNQGRDMDLITQGKIIEFFGNSREDINRTLYSMYMMELIDKSLLERAPLPNLYATLVAVLELINEQGLNLMLVRYFESRLLVNLGYKPVMDHCVLCGSQELSKFKFSLSEGGLLCSSCAGAGDSVILLGGESVALIKLLCNGKLQTVQRVKASPIAMQQVEFFLERYLEYHLERRFKVKNTIRWLKQVVLLSN
ncbi:MAG: DNA repair protein RecO [Firmicutes bacterium HGW-Firmicutes-15]|nr:MAG: DNA repair protein RecO [Firmicutes bacterium HGW-Firmicutes-15]